MFWFWFAILLLISFTFIGCGIYMLYSAITGKGIPHPGENALSQFKIQYHLRGGNRRRISGWRNFLFIRYYKRNFLMHYLISSAFKKNDTEII